MNEQAYPRQLASDLAAGTGVGAASAWALTALLQVPMVVALCAAAVVFLRVFCGLRRQHAGPRFALAPFELAGLEFEADGPLELDSIAASLASGAAPEPAAATLPTVIQMQESIRLRLNARKEAPTGEAEQTSTGSAADELRAALRNLRRSIV
jgi:hypothetical protein